MSTSQPPNQDDVIAELASLTGLPASEAEQYLSAANGDIQTAAALFFDGSGPQGQGAQDEDDADMADSDAGDAPQKAPTAPPQPGGGRTLGGAYVPAEASSSSAKPAAKKKQPAQRGLRTLKDLQSAGGSHSHDDDDDDDEHEQDFFTGGEKSGLAVHGPGQGNPADHINNILKRARENAPRPGGEDEEERPSSHFRGTARTLGGDDAPSRTISDPAAEAPQPAPRAQRELHLWRDGFSVDDGPLYRYDDPANARTLEMINTGHAPLHILNVEHGQEVDVEVHPHKEEDYKKPKKKYVPFGGSGQRLGSPTPGAPSTPAPAPAATSSTTPAPTSSAPAQPQVTVDESVPMVTLQIRLGDGTTLRSRFNTTHTVGDVYDFVRHARTTDREYALMTTFPSKELSDKKQALGDIPEFKRGGVVVQKWK